MSMMDSRFPFRLAIIGGWGGFTGSLLVTLMHYSNGYYFVPAVVGIYVVVIFLAVNVGRRSHKIERFFQRGDKKKKNDVWLEYSGGAYELFSNKDAAIYRKLFDFNQWELHPQLVAWINANIKGKVRWMLNETYLGEDKKTYMVFRFSQTDDAVRFRLIWL